MQFKMDLEKNAVYEGQTQEKIQNEKAPLISYRWVFVALAFFAYFMQYFIRNAFPVALVAMVNSTSSSEAETNYSRDACPAKLYNQSEESELKESTTGEFDWDSSQQGYMLGAFFWGSFLSKFLLSRVGEMVGQRATVASGTLIAAVLDLLSPTAARIHPSLFIVVQFLIGVSFGPIAPALFSLLSKWAPRDELSTMITTMFAGASCGGMLGLVVSGWLTDNYGWPITFWLGGFTSLVFVPFWILLVRNTPQEHPWISEYEKKLLEGNKAVEVKKSVPWLKILSSPYVYVCIFASFARMWGDSVFVIEGPSFLHYKIGLDLNTASYVCGANYIFSLFTMMIFGRISDLIINKKYVQKITARKIFHFIGSGGVCVLFILVCFVGCNAMLAVLLWILIGGLAVGTSCSYNISVIDLAPNYTGTVMGILAIGTMGSALAPTVTSKLLEEENGWNKSFYLASGLSLLSSILYLAMMTAEPQPWNFEEENENSKAVKEKTDVHEMQT